MGAKRNECMRMLGKKRRKLLVIAKEATVVELHIKTNKHQTTIDTLTIKRL